MMGQVEMEKLAEAAKTDRTARVRYALERVRHLHSLGILQHNPFSAEDNVNLNILFKDIDGVIAELEADAEGGGK